MDASPAGLASAPGSQARRSVDSPLSVTVTVPAGALADQVWRALRNSVRSRTESATTRALTHTLSCSRKVT